VKLQPYPEKRLQPLPFRRIIFSLFLLLSMAESLPQLVSLSPHINPLTGKLPFFPPPQKYRQSRPRFPPSSLFVLSMKKIFSRNFFKKLFPPFCLLVPSRASPCPCCILVLVLFRQGQGPSQFPASVQETHSRHNPGAVHVIERLAFQPVPCLVIPSGPSSPGSFKSPFIPLTCCVSLHGNLDTNRFLRRSSPFLFGCLDPSSFSKFSFDSSPPRP